MAKKAKILAFAGSLRENAYSKRVVKTAMKGAIDAGAEVTFVDLRDYPMPIYNQDDHEKDGFSENVLKFQKRLRESGGFLICSPEYNGSLPGALNDFRISRKRVSGGRESSRLGHGKFSTEAAKIRTIKKQ